MNDIVLTDFTTALPVTQPEYGTMLQNIQERMPAIVRDSSNFYKSHSQFMQVALDVTAITPIRSIKHTLAEIDRTRSALQEAYIGMRKKQVELKRKQAELEEAEDAFDREMLEVEIVERRLAADDVVMESPDRQIRLMDVVDEATSMGLKAPLVIRMQDTLRHRVTQLNEVFRKAIKDEGYKGDYVPALADEIIVFCKEQLAKYKCPAKVMFVDELPVNPGGKVVRRALR